MSNNNEVKSVEVNNALKRSTFRKYYIDIPEEEELQNVGIHYLGKDNFEFSSRATGTEWCGYIYGSDLRTVTRTKDEIYLEDYIAKGLQKDIRFLNCCIKGKDFTLCLESDSDLNDPNVVRLKVYSGNLESTMGGISTEDILCCYGQVEDSLSKNYVYGISSTTSSIGSKNYLSREINIRGNDLRYCLDYKDGTTAYGVKGKNGTITGMITDSMETRDELLENLQKIEANLRIKFSTCNNGKWESISAYIIGDELIIERKENEDSEQELKEIIESYRLSYSTNEYNTSLDRLGLVAEVLNSKFNTSPFISEVIEEIERFATLKTVQQNPYDIDRFSLIFWGIKHSEIGDEEELREGICELISDIANRFGGETTEKEIPVTESIVLEA